MNTVELHHEPTGSIVELKRARRRVRSALRRAECGSADAGTLGDIIYIPYLVGLLLIGLMFALVGFYRVGASYAVQLGSQIGAVSPQNGNAAIASYWQTWMNSNTPTDAFAVDNQDRTVSASVNTSQSFNSNIIGPWQFAINAGSNMHVRSERFYPGQPACEGSNCNE